MKLLGSTIKQLRIEADLTQQELADKMGVKRQVINYYENNNRKPKTTDIIKLAEIFDISIDYLLNFSTVKTNDPEIQAMCKYTGLSEEALQVLNYYNDLSDNKNNAKLIDTINFLIEQETPYPSGSVYVDGESDEDIEIYETGFFKVDKQVWQEWKANNYISIIGKIRDFFIVEIDEDEKYEIMEKGISKKSTSRIMDFTKITEISGEKMINYIYMPEIQEQLKKGKTKFNQIEED